MAKNIEQKFTVDLSSIVNSSITATKAIRRSNQAQKEAEFQKAIANGMPYEQQLLLRKSQLQAEKDSPFADTEYIASLEKSVAETSKLNRFNKYRTTYSTALGELNGGKINEEVYLNTLRTSLGEVTDPELRLEIQNDIATAEKAVKTYKDNILGNQVKKAKYDGTVATLSDAIARVTNARTNALINGAEDEVTAYDETLSALTSQLTATKVQDSITDFQVKSTTRGTSPTEKLALINSQLSNADANTPIKIGDVTYTSAAQFWQSQRDGYLTGTSEVFGDFFRELNSETKNTLDADTVRHGYPTQPALDSAMLTFNELRSKPEIAPFVNKLDITQAAVMSNAVDTLAKKIIEVGTNNLTFQDADTQLTTITQKYGVNTDAYRIDLDSKLRQVHSSGLITDAEASKMNPNIEVALPKIDSTTPATPTTPAAAPVTAKTTNYAVAKGDTLSSIALKNGVELSKLLEVNPEYQKNPNIVREGANIIIPPKVTPTATPTTPIVTPPVPSTPPSQTQTPNPAPVPAATMPTPAAAPVPATSPAPVQAPVATTPAPGAKPVDYTIASGDTLGAIAAKNGTTVDALAKLNGIADPNKIIAGAKLKLQ